MSETLGGERRVEELYERQRLDAARATEGIFFVLMPVQWAAALFFAFWLSPLTWSGPESRTHIHVYAALLFGGAIVLPAMGVIRRSPGATSTRFVVAAAQVLMGILLIHLCGGRIETHFHVFGSLAILAFYQDWRVLALASTLVAVDHFIRGLYWPQSAYGVVSVESWRFLEHGAWVVFEDVFLLMGISDRLRDMRQIACRQVELERLNAQVERRVEERTRELEQSQERMRQSEKLSAVGQLAAGVAHEINNPLGVILGFAQGMSRQVAAEDALGLPVRSIEREGQRAGPLAPRICTTLFELLLLKIEDTSTLAPHASEPTREAFLRCKALVQNLLTFARTSQADRAALAVNPAVEQALALVRPQAKLAGVRVSASLGEGLPPVLGSKTQLEQVIMNLAKNAIDAMPAGGSLDIATDLLDDAPHSWVRLRFTDDGAGIPADVLPRIFDPFFTTKPLGQGTGLGLSLVNEIVQKHSGDVVVESRPGRTVFTVRLPVRTGEELERSERVDREARRLARSEPARGSISHAQT